MQGHGRPKKWEKSEKRKPEHQAFLEIMNICLNKLVIARIVREDTTHYKRGSGTVAQFVPIGENYSTIVVNVC